MAKKEAFVTPSVIRWAREKAGYDIETAAAKIKRPESEIEQWENGSLRPSLAQARTAARVYRRSLAVFYLPGPPRDFDTLRDFRYLPTDRPREYSPALALLVRQVHSRQDWLREFLVREKVDPLQFIGSVGLNTAPEVVARSIREQLGMPLSEQMACRDRGAALRLWIDKAEESGISICREGKVECKEARGFVLTDPDAPFVYINSTDAIAGQIFTLIHELTHIWLDMPGLSNLEGLDQRHRTPETDVEIFCNRVAAETLLGRQEFEEQWSLFSGEQSLCQQIERVSARFKVSDEVVARRLLEQGRITTDDYHELRQQYAARWQQHRKRKRKPGGNPYYMKLANNGRYFTQMVMSACHSGVVTVRDASVVLGVKANHLPTMAEYAGVPSGRAG